jgi:hypothetical protein
MDGTRYPHHGLAREAAIRLVSTLLPSRIEARRHLSTRQYARLAHVPAKWFRFADKDMRQRENLQRIPILPDHRVIR